MADQSPPPPDKSADPSRPDKDEIDAEKQRLEQENASLAASNRELLARNEKLRKEMEKLKVNLNQADTASNYYAAKLSEKMKEERINREKPKLSIELDQCRKMVAELTANVNEAKKKQAMAENDSNRCRGWLKEERETQDRQAQEIRKLKKAHQEEIQKLLDTITKLSQTVLGQFRKQLVTPDEKRRRHDLPVPSTAPAPVPAPRMRSTTTFATPTPTREPRRITSGLGSEGQITGSEIVPYNQGQSRQPPPPLYHGQFYVATTANATRQQVINIANATGTILRDATTYTVVREHLRIVTTDGREIEIPVPKQDAAEEQDNDDDDELFN